MIPVQHTRAIETVPRPEPPQARSSWTGDRGLLLLLAVVTIVGSVTFNSIPALEREMDVLGNGDAAAFSFAIRNFDPTRPLGNPRETEDRTLADIAEKHKVHHFPYVVFGVVVYTVLGTLYAGLGIPPGAALYSINALLVCVNLVLLWTLLRTMNPNDNPRLPFLALYAVALNTWVFGSTPESWMSSATLVLLVLHLLLVRGWRWTWVAPVIGLAMVNNVILGFLVVFPALRALQHDGPRAGARVLALSTGIAVGAWASVMTALSPIDPMFRPDHFLEYTAWFRDYAGQSLPLWDPYVWKSAVTTLFATSIVSNQPDPLIPQEAMLYTLRGGGLGVLALLAYGSMLALVAVRVLGWVAAERRAGAHLVHIASHPLAWPIVHLTIVLTVTVCFYYYAAFLYSTIAVPVLVLGFAVFLDLRRRLDSALLYGTIATVAACNIAQVAIFRDALLAL